MQGHPELDAGTLRTIAIGLANTAIGRTFQHLEAKSEIEQLRKELTDLRAEMSRQPDAECPDGFGSGCARGSGNRAFNKGDLQVGDLEVVDSGVGFEFGGRHVAMVWECC